MDIWGRQNNNKQGWVLKLKKYKINLTKLRYIKSFVFCDDKTKLRYDKVTRPIFSTDKELLFLICKQLCKPVRIKQRRRKVGQENVIWRKMAANICNKQKPTSEPLKLVNSWLLYSMLFCDHYVWGVHLCLWVHMCTCVSGSQRGHSSGCPPFLFVLFFFFF